MFIVGIAALFLKLCAHAGTAWLAARLLVRPAAEWANRRAGQAAGYAVFTELFFFLLFLPRQGALPAGAALAAALVIRLVLWSCLMRWAFRPYPPRVAGIAAGLMVAVAFATDAPFNRYL